MRPIKFRAYSKKMIQMKQVERIFFNESTVQICHGFTGEDKCIWFFDDIDLMQFTGLHDESGLEIFEGDIVRSWNIIGYVKYCTETASFKPYHENGGFIYNRWEGGEVWQIVGNIHDNPELLSNS